MVQQRRGSNSNIRQCKPSYLPFIINYLCHFFSDRGACAIPDQDTGEVIITGDSDSGTLVSVYSEAGWQRELAPMMEYRKHHACSSFTHAGEKVIREGVIQDLSIKTASKVFFYNFSAPHRHWRRVL